MESRVVKAVKVLTRAENNGYVGVAEMPFDCMTEAKHTSRQAFQRGRRSSGARMGGPT